MLYEAAAIVILSPAGDITSTIDLSSYDSDGNPDADAISIDDTPAGEKAFVALDRLNPYPTSVQPSWMLRIDVPTQAVEAQLVLAGRNPFGPMQDIDGILWIAEPGNFDEGAESDAGVERFDTATSTSALVARETALGGSVAERERLGRLRRDHRRRPDDRERDVARLVRFHDGRRERERSHVAARDARLRPRRARLERPGIRRRRPPPRDRRVPGARFRRSVLAGGKAGRRVPPATADRVRAMRSAARPARPDTDRA